MRARADRRTNVYLAFQDARMGSFGSNLGTPAGAEWRVGALHEEMPDESPPLVSRQSNFFDRTLRNRVDDMPAAGARHSHGDGGRLFRARGARRHDSHRSNISRQMAAGLFRVYFLSRHLPYNPRRDCRRTKDP